MAVLSSQMIGEFGFSANSSTSEEISAFVAESLREISGFVRRDGDSNVGPLHLSSGLSVDVESHVGPGNVINVMYGAAVGEGNVVGVRGYEVRSVSADAETSDADVQFALGEGEELDERIVPGLKTSSTGFQRSTVEFGVVKSVDRASGRAVVNVPDPMIRNDLGGKTLYFTDASGRLVNAGNAVTSGSWSVAVGSNNVVTGSCSRAGGHLSQTIGTYGNAHGKGAVAAWAATAEGCAVRALANASCAWNRATKVGQGASYSVAEGTGTVVDQNMKNCHVAGYMARAKDEGAFVWNGARVSCAFLDPTMTLHREPHAAQGWKVPGTALEGDNDAMTQEFIDHPAALSSMYASHGEGTFNVNPQGGLGGFYVGERSLLDAVEGAVTAAISVEIGRLKDDVWTGNIYVAGSPEEKTYVKRADLPPGGSFSYRGLPAGAPLSDLQPDEDLVEVVALADRYASVSDYAFAKCARLRRATLAPAVSVGVGAFEEDRALVEASLPAAEYASPRAFYNCTVLSSIDAPRLKDLGQLGMYNCVALREVSLPELTAGGVNSFGNNSALSSISVPSLARTGINQFINCRKLSSISLPSISSFAGNTFGNCAALLCVDMRGLPPGRIPTAGATFADNVGHAVSCYVPDGQAQAWRDAVPAWAALERLGQVALVD